MEKEITQNITNNKSARQLDEQKFDITLSSIGDAVISTDNKGNISFMNPVAEMLTGWKFKEAFNRPSSQIFKIINEDTRKLVESPIQKVLQSGNIVGLANHTLLIRKDGGEIPIDDSGAPIKDENGRITGVVLVFRDISERKEAEKKLRQSETRLKRAQEMAHLGSWELDLNTNKLNWSDEIFRIFGLQPQEFQATYEAFLKAVHPEDRLAVDAAYSGSIKDGSDQYEIEHRIVRNKSGEIRYVHEKCFHIKDVSGKVVRSLGMVHDITDRKIAELALKESEEKVRKKLECILDPEGNIDVLELEDIINVGEIQSMMEFLYELTSMPMAIIDLKGTVIVGVGWQDICTRFHRVHPSTCKNCLESDLQLTSGIPEGEFKLYRCANGMWDIATPLIIGGQHKGNLFMGQFFFEDEQIDQEAFKRRAAIYGFKQDEYLTALNNVVRISRRNLESAKGFFLKFANKITKLSYSNIKLARSIKERDIIHQELLRNNERLNLLSETAGRLLASPNPQAIVDELCTKVMGFLECDIFVNYFLDYKDGKLHLNASGGVSPKSVKQIETLRLGVAVCGCVARDGKRIIATDIQQSDDPRTKLVKSFGIQAYCCHPLLGQGEVLGTLSFGTKSRKSFTEEEISMMKMVADLVAIATDRLKNVQALQESEKQATQRAEELQKMMNIVPSAIWIAQDPECLQITGNDTANRFYEAREGENVSAGVDPSIRRFFRNGVELSAKELTMQVAASSGTEIRNSELEVLLPSGRWMTMLGNASPLKDENGKVRGCVGAFMDITDRKEAEKENQLMIQLLQISNESQNVKEFIHSSLEFFRSLANFDAVGLRLKKGIDYPYYETIGFSQDFIRTEKYLCAHDKKGDILLDAHCHPQYECLCGQVISRKVENDTFSTEFGSIWSNDSSSLNIRELEQQLQRRIRGRCIREGYQSISLIPLKLRNENIGLLQLNDRRKGLINSDKIALIERLSGPFSIALARFLAEEEVQNKEENLRQHAEMLEHAPVLVRTMQGEITVWNSGMEKLYGYNRAEALGQNEEQLLRTQFPKPLSEIMDEMLQKNFWEGELVHSCKDGSIVEVLSLWTLHHDQQGNPVAIIEVNNDITNRKKKEQELHRANRVLNALGKSSQTMMHSQNEMQFINEVCKILVEDCGHSLVWIGYAQDNKAKTVLPVAHSGFDEGYLANLRVSWADDEYGRGPTGMAIKTGKACLSRNITTDPCFEPWRKDAQQRGYNSSIALPLHSNGKVFGVLALYSKDVSSFSPDEVDLLTRLSEDLSFGINTIRLRESENTAIALLTQSEQKYRTLFNEMAEGFTYHQLIQDEMGNTRDYLFLDVNPAFEKHTGMSAEQVIGKKASEIYPDMNIYWIGIYEDVALHGVNREFEVYNPSLNRFFRVSAFSTQKGYFATIFENITDRVLSQKELQSTKNYLESLINYANAPIIVWNDKMEIKLFNRAFEHLTGYGADEVLGKPLDMLFPVAYAGEIKLKIQQTKYENWESIEIPILTKGKETRTILWNSANIYDPDSNHLISVIAQGNDITERKKAERQLKEAQEKLILALDNGKIGTWEMDLRSSYLVWDKRMEQMFGFAAGTFDGRYETFENCLVEEDRTEVRDAIWRAVGESKPYETVLRIRNPYGDINYINAKALVIHDSEGKPVRMSGVCFDITDMKKGAERILFKLNEDLHRSNKELEQFAYVASHDLQEPLRMVSSFTQLLAQRYKDKLDQDGKEFIHYAVDGAVRMQRLINDLLNYSRIGTRGQKFNWVNFQDVMQKTLSNLKIRIEEKNASIFYDGLPSVKGDDIQLIQLMQNLIGNALKFCKAEPVIQISAIESDNYYQFSVKDNGIGIEPQYFDKIFLIFQRLLPKDRYEGTGIGLAICKRIVERHGGKIWVESTPGEGTTFYFTLIKN